MSDVEQERPWYRQFWPWFIAFPPAATVIGGFVTLWLAGTGPSLVVDDYGQIGKVTMQRAVRDERALELNLSARVVMDAISNANDGIVGVDVSLAGNQLESPKTVILRIVHPTRAEQDVETLLPGVGRRYKGRIPRPTGRLYIHISDPEKTWRLVGELGARATELQLVPKQTGV